jgi:hypothetical protein
MEEGATNTPDSGRQKAKVDSPCNSSPSSIIPHFDINAIHQQEGSSTVQSLEFQVAGDTSTTLNTGTSQGESVQINMPEPCPSKYLSLFGIIIHTIFLSF